MRFILSLSLLFMGTNWAGAQAEKTLLGFSSASTSRQLEWEKRFDASIRKEDLRAWMKELTRRPHHLGSPYGRHVAEFIAGQLKSWGYETEIERFDVLFPTPKSRLLEMTAPVKFSAKLDEPALPEDETSSVRENMLPPYNAYSIDGDVSGLLVYVNYGLPLDYEYLEQHGIEVKGKIVIARYGNSWRGIKVKVAAEKGAVGCIIYSDPADDGYGQGDSYPKGEWRSGASAQRGSVADMPVRPGDPLTPGIGATNGARRLKLEEAETLTKIPVLPISYEDALPLLRELAGPVVPSHWRGALPITYHAGPGPALVHLRAQFDWKTVPVWNVIARVKGSEAPDEWILRGNHHDAWVFGADDPVSGTIAVMEEARAMSEIMKQGWRPRRTVIFALWDGEEPGLLGSTEWVEAHAEDLRKHAVAYLNGDSNENGLLRVGGSHVLEKFMNEIAGAVIDPEKKVTVGERLRAYRKLNGTSESKKEARERAGFRISALGSGSDYTPFLQHLGIASMDIRYAGESAKGSYHSIYDSFDHYTRFLDPDFEYGEALVKTAGRGVLRLAGAEVIPFEFNSFAETVGKYIRETISLTDEMRQETRVLNQFLSDGTFRHATDSKDLVRVPAPKEEVPFVNFSPLQNAWAELERSAQRFENARKKFTVESLSAGQKERLNHLLIRSERLLTRDEGLPARPWYKHLIYAPGFYTGYGVKTIPGVREAIEQRQWKQLEEQILALSGILREYSRNLDAAGAVLLESKSQAN